MDDGPLDMRYNPELNGPTAADLLNNSDELTLRSIFKRYGDIKSPNKLITYIL